MMAGSFRLCLVGGTHSQHIKSVSYPIALNHRNQQLLNFDIFEPFKCPYGRSVQIEMEEINILSLAATLLD